MAVVPLEGIISTATTTSADWEKSLDWLNASASQSGQVFDTAKPIPGQTPEASINSIGLKLTAAVALTQTLSAIQSVDAIPDIAVPELGARVSAVRAVVEKLWTHLSALEGGVALTTIDAENMTAANEKGQSLTLPPIFIELYPAIQALLVALYQMRAMAGLSQENGPLLELSRIVASRAAQKQVLGEVTRLRRAVEVSHTKVGKLVEATQTVAGEVEELKKKAIDAVAKSDEAKAKADDFLKLTTTINAAANTVQDAVTAYNEQFTKFQADLDARNVAFAKGQQDVDKLLTDSKSKFDELTTAETAMLDSLRADLAVESKEMDRLLARSREILGEATAAGLSEHFAEEKNAVGRQIVRNQGLYFLSIAFLFLSAGIVLNAIPWFEKYIHLVQIQPTGDSDLGTITAFYLVNFLSKLTLLLPSLLLIIFAGRRYTELFRLKAHYTYKYTVAASLTGFRMEAPTYAEAITASAFKELLFNPGAAIAAPEEGDKKEGNTFLERLVDPLVKKALDKMGEIPKTPRE